MCWYLVVLLFIPCIEKCVPQFVYVDTREVVYEIAGLFEHNALTQRLAFNESTRHANMNSRRLDPVIIQPSRIDSYSVWRELCKNRSMRPIAVFGPQNAISDGAIRDQCAIANIPHLQAAWQPFDPDLDLNEEETSEDEFVVEEETAEEAEGEKVENEEEEEIVEEPPTFKKITINFYPDPNEIALAYAGLLRFYKWESFAVLYEDDFGLLRIQKILAEHTSNYPIIVRRLDPEGDNHKIFKELVKFQESRILLDCHVDRIEKYMRIANESRMVNHYQHYILVSLDASLVAEKITLHQSNITWLSLTDYDQTMNPQHVLAPRVGGWKVSGGSPPVSSFQLEALLMDDMAKHVIDAVRSVEVELELSDTDMLPKPRTYMCEGDAEPWTYGALLQNKILKTKTQGVTGNIEFDETGRRVNYTLYVNEIYVSKRHIIGRWESAAGGDIIYTRNDSDSTGGSLTVHKFIVISRKAKPYFYDKEKCVGENCTEGDEYEGFSVDLVKAICDQLNKENFSYSYEFINEDKTYGKYNPTTKKWDGLIGDLLDKKADLAVCDLTITEERKKVVDFSVPFMSLGISILYTKEHKVAPWMFSFLNPYTVDVWMYTATAYCIVSIFLFICARISPADWENPQPCDKDPEELENIWNFKNCAWLTMGSIMTQGCDILPKAFGTRWVCGMWWFFAVIVCQTYIAQLSASMTSASENEPINSIEDLAKQNKILYGAIDGGSTLEFFKSSKDKMYTSMYENMKANPVVLVNSNDEGEKRVLKGKNRYAFFMESSTIEYKLKRDCALKKVGGELDSKDYGIAMPANSPFRSHINRAILKLKELTILEEIKRKWWQEKYGAKDCKEETDANDVEGDLEMENLIGAFLVLIMGLVLGVFITAAEFMNEVRNIVVREQVTHKEAFIKELKASLNFFQLQKPILRNPSRAASIAATDKPDTEDKINRRVASITNFIDFEKAPQ